MVEEIKEKIRQAKTIVDEVFGTPIDIARKYNNLYKDRFYYTLMMAELKERERAFAIVLDHLLHLARS